MKKLLALILVLAILLPAAGLSEFYESPYKGNWAGIQHRHLGGFTTILHYLFITEDGVSLYMVSGVVRNTGAKPPEAEYALYRGKCEPMDNGHMIIQTSDSTTMEIGFDDAGDLVCYDPYVIFMKLK